MVADLQFSPDLISFLTDEYHHFNVTWKSISALRKVIARGQDARSPAR